MSDLILVKNVNNIISNINDDYDINKRLKFLENKHKDTHLFKIINNVLQCKKKTLNSSMFVV